MVSNAAIEAHRIAGERLIYPDELEIAAMTKTGIGTVAIIKLCLDERGEPSKVSLVRSSGHGNYDVKIATAIAGWRFRPFRMRSTPVPVCTSVTLIYRPPQAPSSAR